MKSKLLTPVLSDLGRLKDSVFLFSRRLNISQSLVNN